MSENLEKIILKEVQLKNREKLILREAVGFDAKDIIEYLNIVGGESNNLLFGEGEFHLTIEEEEVYIENMNKDKNSLMLLGIIENSIVSISQITSSSRNRIAHNSELCISVKKDYWKSGIGTVVMEELINFAKRHDKIKNISLGVKSSNKNAIKLYEKFGFNKIGAHKDFFNINGQFDDEILMDRSL